MRLPLPVLAVLAALLFAGLAPPSTAAAPHSALPATSAAAAVQSAERERGTDRLRLFAPFQEPQGRSWSLWHARWLEWIQEIPVPRNPAFDPDSRRNCERQYRAVLMGPSGTGAGCEVPANRPIVLSFLGWSCSTAEGNGRSWRKLRQCAIQSFEQELTDVRVHLRLDGRHVDNPKRWTFDSAHRVVRLPEENVWGVPPGRTRSLGRAQLFMLRPMGPGEHVVRARTKEAGEVAVFRYRFTVV